MHALYMKFQRFLLLAMLFALLGACGQKGDLYLPDKAEAPQDAEQQQKTD